MAVVTAARRRVGGLGPDLTHLKIGDRLANSDTVLMNESLEVTVNDAGAAPGYLCLDSDRTAPCFQNTVSVSNTAGSAGERAATY